MLCDVPSKLKDIASLEINGIPEGVDSSTLAYFPLFNSSQNLSSVKIETLKLVNVGDLNLYTLEKLCMKFFTH